MKKLTILAIIIIGFVKRSNAQLRFDGSYNLTTSVGTSHITFNAYSKGVNDNFDGKGNSSTFTYTVEDDKMDCTYENGTKVKYEIGKNKITMV